MGQLARASLRLLLVLALALGAFAAAELPDSPNAAAAYRKTACDYTMSYGPEGIACVQANGGWRYAPQSFKVYRTVIPTPWNLSPKVCRVGFKLWFVYPNGRRYEEYSPWYSGCRFAAVAYQWHWGFSLPARTLVCGGVWTERRNRSNKAVGADGHACYRVG